MFWTQGRKVVVSVFGFLFTVLILHFTLGVTLYENMTLSADRGIYLGWNVGLDKLKYGDFVIFRLPYMIGYLPEGHFMLKQVEGKPGDTYKVYDDRLEIRGETYKIARSIKELPQLAVGEYVVPDDHYLFLNHVETSFDGRYLGVIHKKELVAKVWIMINYEKIYETLLRWGWVKPVNAVTQGG